LRKRRLSRSGVDALEAVEVRKFNGLNAYAVFTMHSVVYLASDAAKFVTGTEMVIDGGMSRATSWRIAMTTAATLVADRHTVNHL
jgi:NAD(P)-dependent dehydrogenase (short-subunit alcohol dehydrogenase family)